MRIMFIRNVFLFVAIAGSPKLAGAGESVSETGLQSPPHPPDSKTNKVQEKLVLKVFLSDPFNPHTELLIPLELNKEFRSITTDREVTTTLIGVVRKVSKKTYRLELKTSEWKSETNNTNDSATWKLELDKPQNSGPASSFVYLRSVTLMNRNGR